MLDIADIRHWCLGSILLGYILGALRAAKASL
jgi:hypothetical protein